MDEASAKANIARKTSDALFGEVAQQPTKKGGHEEFSQIIDSVNTLSRRVRMLEERYYNIRKKTTLTDQNMLEDNKGITQKLKFLTDSINDLKKKISDVVEKLTMFDEELKDTAKKSDLDVIKKYLDFWEPINFLTEKEAVKLIKDYLDEINLK